MPVPVHLREIEGRIACAIAGEGKSAAASGTADRSSAIACRRERSLADFAVERLACEDSRNWLTKPIVAAVAWEASIVFLQYRALDHEFHLYSG